MDWVIIQGVKPYDGRYRFDINGEELTTREWGWIKRFSGYFPMTVEEGLEGVDPELLSVFALIALRRAGKIETNEAAAVFDRLADAPFGSAITLDTDTEDVPEDDAGPPASSSNANGASSGAASTTSSESSDANRPATGTPGSAISASEQPTWVT